MNISLLKKWFRELETVGADPGGGVTRLAYSPEEDAMFLKIAGFAAEMGLNVSEDCIGNMYISFPGREGTPCHGIGSHLDSVPQGDSTTARPVSSQDSLSWRRSGRPALIFPL